MSNSSQNDHTMPLAMFLASLVLLMLAFFWQYVIFALIGFLVVKYITRFIWDHIKCQHCHGTGQLHEHDPHLEVDFHDEPCFICVGTGIPKKDRRRWHDLAQISRQRLAQLNTAEQKILLNMSQYRRSMKISVHAPDGVGIAFEKAMRKNNAQLTVLETEQSAYALTLRQSLINAHTIHLLRLTKDQVDKVESWEQQHWDIAQQSLEFLQDVNLDHRLELIPLIRQQQFNPYHELLPERMRQDIEIATLEFCTLIENTRRA